jgi:hypothetical protein
MENAKKKRINALDVLIVLLIAAMIAAFFFRGQILSFFEEEETEVVTYSFVITDVEREHAAYLKKDCVLYNGGGESVGKVLAVVAAEATDDMLLADGNAVQVKNGSLDLSGTVTATGYTVGEFVYLADGTLLVPGGTVTVSTGEAIYTLTVTDVESTPENRAN